MNSILSKRLLAPRIWELTVDAPRVARSAKPGQFVIVRTDEKGERIPLTICDYDSDRGTLTLVIQEVGLSSRKICALEPGQALADVAGPLGRPSDLLDLTDDELKDKRILFIAGGVGTAPVYPQAKYLHDRGFTPDVIIGARTQELFSYVEEMKKVARVHLCTDDGSLGFHGNVTALLADMVENRGEKFDRCVIIGPMIMMKFGAMATKKYGIPTMVSLNALMVDGTGMCGACRVTVGGKTRFTCVEGPEFDGHQVDYDEAMRRQAMYKENPKCNPQTHTCSCHA